MSYRRRSTATNQPRQEFAVYKKVRSSSDDEEENFAPEYIRIPVEKAEKQAIKVPKGAALQQPTPRRRQSTPQRRVGLPRTPPLEDELPSPRTPRRRSSTPAAGRSRATPKRNRGNESDFVDGRGSPEERRRKSKLAQSLPRRSDGKFARKNEDPSEEYSYQSGNESEDSFRGYSNKKKKAQTPDNSRRRSLALKKRAPTPHPQRRAPVKESSGDSDTDDSISLSDYVVVPKNNAPNQVLPSGRIGNDFSRNDDDDHKDVYSRQSNKVTNNHINTSLTMLVMSDSTISFGSTDNGKE